MQAEYSNGSQAPLPSGGGGLLVYFTTFFKIGLFTLGGGYAMIPLIEAEVVEKGRWVAKEEFADLIAIAQSCPGVFAINISTFIGYRLRRTAGAVTCALGAAMPSFLIILAIAIFFRRFEDNAVVAAMFRGIRPAVVALIAVPTFNMARRAHLNRYTLWIPVVSALLIWLLGVSPIYIIVAAATGGYLWGKTRNNEITS